MAPSYHAQVYFAEKTWLQKLSRKAFLAPVRAQGRCQTSCKELPELSASLQCREAQDSTKPWHPNCPSGEAFLEARIIHSGLRFLSSHLGSPAKVCTHPYTAWWGSKSKPGYPPHSQKPRVSHTAPANCQELSQHLWLKMPSPPGFPTPPGKQNTAAQTPPHSLTPQNPHPHLRMLRSKKCISKRGLGAFHIPQELYHEASAECF